MSLVVDATVKTGIARQMEAFGAGFNQVPILDNIFLFQLHYNMLIKYGIRKSTN